jgi:hypothetical protein
MGDEQSKSGAASKTAMATAPAPRTSIQAESRSVRLPGEDLSLNEMLRVMDVAREMRRNRDVAEEMFRRDEVRAELRAKLMRSAEIAGDRVTAAEVDAAIDQYLTNLHTFSDPPPSFTRMLAHTWVWRRRIVAGIAAAAITLGGFWYLFLSPLAPFAISPTVVNERAVAAEQETAQRFVDQIRAVSQDPGVIAQAETLQRQIDATGSSAAEVTAAIAARQELARMAETLTQTYEVHVVSKGDLASALERGKDDLDSLYYVIVEARDASGNVVPRTIRNAETGNFKTVTTWAEQVPPEVYRRLEADKDADGILGETLFATKARGELDVKIQMPGPAGTVTQGAQLTDW